MATVHPYQPCDIPLPRDVTGFCYLLVSTQNWSTTYIGETSDLHERLKRHNSGLGSKQTSPLHLRPWALVAYVAGFMNSREERKKFEKAWRNTAAARINHGGSQRSVDTIVLTAADLIHTYIGVNTNSESSLPLRLVQHARLSTNDAHL